MPARFNKIVWNFVPEALTFLKNTRTYQLSGILILIFTILFPNVDTQAQPYGNEWIDYSKVYYKFPVREQRFYRIPFATLTSNGLGQVPVEQFQLWRDGKEVPLFTSVPTGLLPANGFIEFFGTANTGVHETPLFQPGWHYHPDRSMFSDTAYYFLTINPTGNNLRFTPTENKVLETRLLPDSFYMQTLNPLISTNGFYGGNAELVEGVSFRSANWDIGEGLVSSRFDFNRTVQFNFTAMQAFMHGPDMRIEYTTFGVRNPNRYVILRLNDQRFDSIFVPGINGRHRLLENIPTVGNILNDGINFKFNSNFFDTTDWENNVLGRFLLTYPRQFFHNTHVPIEIGLPSNLQGNHIRLRGLPNGVTPPVLYDFTNLKRYEGILGQDVSLFALDASENERKIVIGTQVANQIRMVGTMQRVEFRNFLLQQNQGNYLIISNKILRGGAVDAVEAYRQYRGSSIGGNFNAKIYDIDEIADQFCFGVRKNPMAIRRFILFALDKFAQTPKMVYLIGKGSNYFSVFRSAANINREILNAVPTWGTPSSDNLLACRNLKIPVPAIPIGRLSVINGQEIMDYLHKVKEFENLQRLRPVLPSQNEWRKKVLHLVGGDDDFTARLLGARMGQNAAIIRLPKIANTVNQYSRIDSIEFANNLKMVEERIGQGVGLISYFGHSSASSIDFNLGSPDPFNNPPGKYPVFLANGCRAGNIFDFNGNRLVAQEVTISENFVLSPDKGAIAFISHSDLAAINYQNLLMREWYNAFNNFQFGQTIGEIQREALSRSWQRTASINDPLNIFNLEQTILHGDPAIRPFPITLPDFAVEGSFVNIDPKIPFTELDSIDIKIKYFNVGTAVPGQVQLHVERELPNGTAQTLLSKNLTNLFNEDSLTLKIGLKGLFEEGNGFIIARLDKGGDWQEWDKDNNVAVIPLKIERNHVMPIYPYNYSIINTPSLTLKASSTNPTDSAMPYTLQLDTTVLFNSPLLITKEMKANAGLIEWSPEITMSPDQVYYWRVQKTGVLTAGNAGVFSFIYKPGSFEGYNQSHFYQHKNSKTAQIKLEEDRIWSYQPKLTNLYVSHGIFPISASEDVHLSMTVNGQRDIYSACIGRSIVFNLFDPVTFKPIRNADEGSYGSAAICAPGREYNFEFGYFPRANRKAAMDFIDAIPDGTIVTARLVVDPPVDSSFSARWKNDTIFFGSGNSLYHSLVKHGFYDLDSLNRHRTFFFMFKKGDSASFKPVSIFSRGSRDRIHASLFPTITDKSGKITSPWMGPANGWQEAIWDITFENEASKTNSTYSLGLWGKTNSGERVKLQNWNSLSDKINISAIDAQKYPMLQFEMEVEGEEFGYDAPQINYWQLYYDPLPDGAWSPNDHFALNKDTLQPFSDVLSLQMAFKNTSASLLGTTIAKVYILDLSNNLSLIYQQNFRSLQPNDTAILNLNRELSLPQGFYQLLVEVNEEGNPLEQHYFNNRFILPFVVDGGTLPIRFLRFDAQKIGQKVALHWETTRDNTVESYHVEHSGRSAEFVTIARDVKNSNTQNENLFFSATHDTPVIGGNYYRLRLQHKNGSTTYSEIRKVLFEDYNLVKALPNPFDEYFNLQPLDNNVPWEIRIIDSQGKIVHTEKGLGSKRIHLGNQASGMYILQWSAGDKIQNIKMVKQ
jgi:hypothetical protein